MIADRAGPIGLLAAGLIVLILADIVLAVANTVGLALAGAALWGIHMGLTQGLLSKLVADTAPAELRGTGFGLFSLISGGAILVARMLAGLLWDRAGPPTTFIAGAARIDRQRS